MSSKAKNPPALAKWSNRTKAYPMLKGGLKDGTNDRKPSAKKPRLSSTKTELNIQPVLQWKPMIATSVWVNDQLHDMVTVVIPLTGGVDISCECEVFVSDNNNDLVVSEKIVDMLANVERMHKYWSKKDPNAFLPSNPKILGFHKYFSGIRKREDDDIYHTAIIPLPFPVQKNIVNTYKLSESNGTRLLYVELRGVDDDDDADDDPTTNHRKPSAKKPRLGSTKNELNIQHVLQWKPMIATSVWVNDQLNDMVTVVVPLTGGVDISCECEVFVSDNNNDLVVSEKIVDMLANVERMHKDWSKKYPNASLPSNPKILGFHKYFSGIRKREDDDIYHTAIIPLPFPVQKAIVNLYKLGESNGTRMLYVELHALEYNDYKVAAKSDLLWLIS